MLTIKKSRPIRGNRGLIIEHAEFQEVSKNDKSIRPPRGWFSNTRVSDQGERDEKGRLMPNEVILKRCGVVVCQDLFPRRVKPNYDKVIERKKPDVEATEMVKVFGDAALHQKNAEEGIERRDDPPGDLAANSGDCELECGKSKRIWKQFYNVIDSSSVIVHVVDARDPLGTLCRPVLKSTKKVIIVVNKVDLVPPLVTSRWLKLFGQKYLCVAFHSNSIERCYGRDALISLLKQIAKLKGRITVGVVGYPNVGKSSIINVLRRKKVCSVAPVAGETKVYQYITLTKKIYLIDSPGIVPISSKIDSILRGTHRVEKLNDVELVFEKVYERYGELIKKVYGIDSDSPASFLESYCIKNGRLGKGGVADINQACKTVIDAMIRGRVPFYANPPGDMEWKKVVNCLTGNQ